MWSDRQEHSAPIKNGTLLNPDRILERARKAGFVALMALGPDRLEDDPGHNRSWRVTIARTTEPKKMFAAARRWQWTKTDLYACVWVVGDLLARRLELRLEAILLDQGLKTAEDGTRLEGKWYALRREDAIGQIKWAAAAEGIEIVTYDDLAAAVVAEEQAQIARFARRARG